MLCMRIMAVLFGTWPIHIAIRSSYSAQYAILSISATPYDATAVGDLLMGMPIIIVKRYCGSAQEILSRCDVLPREQTT